MKKITLAFIFLLCAIVAIAHPPAKFNYQGVARDSKGIPLANQLISLRISIIDVVQNVSTVIYTETQIDTTNAFGLFNIEVGGGVVVLGKMDAINWASGEKYMKVELDPNGGTAYAVMGTTRLLSVPFARRAEDAGALTIYGGDGVMTSNTNKMLIRYSPKYPTWGLYFNDADIQFNFLKGGISVMDIDLGLSKVNVNGDLKVSGGSPAPGKVLISSDSVGNAAWQDFSTKISSFQPTGCQSLQSVTATYQKIGDMGTFTKSSAGTIIELNLQTNLYVTTLVGAVGVAFELRIDDTPTTVSNATALVRSNGTYDPVTITGLFTNLASGTHTVSLWAKAINGTATNAGWDEGCLNSAGINNIFIKEFR